MNQLIGVSRSNLQGDNMKAARMAGRWRADLMAVAGFMLKGPTRRLSPVSGEERILGVKPVACCMIFPGRNLCMSVRGYL